MAAQPREGAVARPLSTWERGFVLAALRALGDGAPEFLAARPHLAAAARALGEGVARAREVVRLGATPPEGIERVHPSWWEKPPPAARPAARLWMERAATAHLVPMVAPVGDSSSLGSLDLLPAEPLAELLSALGRRRLAIAFSAAPPGSLAQLCARLGEPAASELLAESRRVRPTHDEARAAQRSLFKLTVDATADPGVLLPFAGARWLGPALHARGGDLLARVAQRLPIDLGGLLLAQAGAPALPDEWAACETAVEQLARR